jgi:hypothetical protein
MRQACEYDGVQHEHRHRSGTHQTDDKIGPPTEVSTRPRGRSSGAVSAESAGADGVVEYATEHGVRPAGRRFRIEHRPIRARRPQQSGKVERSRRIDAEEFRGLRRAGSYLEAETALHAWQNHCNAELFSMALAGRTPTEKPAALMAP